MTTIQPRPPRVQADLTRGSSTVVISDSIYGGGTDHTLGRETGYTSPFTMIAALSGGRIRHLYNAGINGDNLVNMDARFATDVVARKPAWVWIAGGTNDIAIHTLAQMQAAIRSMVVKAKSAKINVILFGITGSARGTSYNNIAQQFNAWLVAYCSAYGLHFVNQWDLTWDNVARAMKSTYTDDGLHFNKVGVSAVSQAMWAKIAAVYPLGGPYLSQSHPDGVCPLTYATFETDTNADGVSDTWSTSGSGPGITWSRVSDASLPGMYWQKAVTSQANSSQTINQNVGSGNWSVGELIAVACRVLQVGCEATGTTAAVNVFFGSGATAPTNFYACFGQSMDVDRVIYAEYVIPTGATQMTLNLGASTVASTSGECWFQRPTWVNLTRMGAL